MMTNKPSHPRSKYRREIDGLRAFAVIAVIINHFNKDVLPSGYLGVDIFFVISGFVITSSLSERESKNFQDFLMGFYERRIKRLVPALVAFVLITSVLICLFNPDPGVVLGLGWRSLFGISNINIYQTSTDYFAPSSALNPFTHTWSLGVEEQFYLLFPFLIWFSGFGRKSAKGARNLLFCVGVLTIASLFGFVYLYKVNQPAAYFLMPPRFWEMAAGCLIFIGFQRRARMEQALEQVPPFLVVAAMIGVMLLPLSAAVPATISIVLLSSILIACLKRGTAAYDFFTLDKVVFVGLISYSLYLWHWTVLCISRWTIGIHWWSTPLQAVLMLLLATWSYKWIETPLRRSKWSAQRWKTVGIGLIGSLSAATLLIGYVRAAASHSIFLGSNNKRDQESYSRQPPSKWCNIYLHYPKAINLAEDCGSMDFKGRPTLYSLGDSHGHQFNDFWADYAKQNRYNYLFVWGNRCLFPAAVLREGGETCFDAQKTIEKKILSRLKRDDIVVVGNALSNRFDQNWSDEEKYYTRSGVPLSVDDAAKIFSHRFQELADVITSKGAKVVFYIDSVQFPGLNSNSRGDLCKTEWYRPPWALAQECLRNLDDYLRIVDRHFSWRDRWDNGRTKIVWNAYKYGDSCLGNACNASKYIDSNHFASEYAGYHLHAFVENHPGIFVSNAK